VSSIWVVGEALIDRIPSTDGDHLDHVGGGPANTAKALSRLGLQTSFIGGISSDIHGSAIEAELTQSGVDLSLSVRSELPTAMATATIDGNGFAHYTFELEGTATFAFDASWLPTSVPDVIHIGSLATILEPGASSLLEWISCKKTPIVFDPNVRPSVQNDKDLYRISVDRWIDRATVIKLSEDDLDWLYGGEGVVDDWLERGVSLVIITRAERGLQVRNNHLSIHVPARQVPMVDSVGAGDTVGAVVTEGIVKYGISNLNETHLTSILQRAVHAASITCSRVGANPPWLVELEETILN